MLGVLIIGAFSAAPALAASCRNTESFAAWLGKFKRDALAQGISQRVLSDAAPELVYDPSVIRRDRGQAIFQETFLTFSDKLLGGYRIPNGKKQIEKHARLFARIEQRFGVPAPVLTAFWGLESDYGGNFGKFKILPALTTLAYDCRRGDYFRPELVDALRIVQRGDQRISEMIGSWAGEFGGMQFTASRYIKYGVDFDGDGRIDIIHSTADTLASAANYIKDMGWKRGEPWLQEVTVPQHMPWREADLDIQHPVSQWEKWGVRAAHGRLPHQDLPASLILPMGRKGPAFLAYPNFKVFLGWNSSFVYSTTVAYFATRLAGAPPVSHAGAKSISSLSIDQMKELQTLLNRDGFDAGKVDGKLGNGTREAVKKAQLKYGMPADSWPTAELLSKLRGS
ncbi:MAG TPA: lytic murein transglycosylase [Pseudolabrys sp.]|nr:lytic murein transglycosylase [Pseudolabrys sp.]